VSARGFIAALLIALVASAARADIDALRATPVPAEITVPADLPYEWLSLLGSLPLTTIVLDLSRGKLSRARVDLADKLAASIGARVRGAISAADAKLLRLLRPSVLVVDVADGEDALALASSLSGLEARAFRFELPKPPTAAQLTAWKRLRPVTVRFPLAAAGDTAAQKTVLAQLAAWPGRTEITVAEDLKPDALRSFSWPERVALHVAPAGGSYLADATLDSLLAAARTRHVVSVSLPMERVDAPQLRRLPGVSLELLQGKPPTRAHLRSLRRTILGLPWPPPEKR